MYAAVTVAAIEPGAPLLFRSVYDGSVKFAFSNRFVARDGDRLALYLAIGTRGFWLGRDEDGRYLERWARGDAPHEHVWHTNHILWLARPLEWAMLGLVWDESWRFQGWYVNLQAPLRTTSLGFDTTDWALDIWVEPDQTWHWKDEDDFAEAQALGVLDANTAAAVRVAGEQVIADWPFPTGWEDWRPDPRWTPPPLPDSWDVV